MTIDDLKIPKRPLTRYAPVLELDEPIVSMIEHQDRIYVATSRSVYRMADDEKLEPLMIVADPGTPLDDFDWSAVPPPSLDRALRGCLELLGAEGSTALRGPMAPLDLVRIGELHARLGNGLKHAAALARQRKDEEAS